jgi:hypothetical protein
MSDSGCWMSDSDCWMSDSGCWMSDSGYWMSDSGYWMSDSGYWMSDSACRPMKRHGRLGGSFSHPLGWLAVMVLRVRAIVRA